MSRRSLKGQLIGAVALSLLVAAAVFALCYPLGLRALESTVYGKPFMAQVERRKAAELQDFVRREQITPAHLRPLDAWCSGSEQLYLAMYRQGALIYESEAASQEGSDIMLEDLDRGYPLTLDDGTAVMAFLYYYAGDAYYYWMVVACVVAAMAAFTVCLVLLVSRKVAYIRQLRRELDILSGGDMTYAVTVKGGDELGELAEGIDQIRRSIAAHRDTEQQIRKANSELITAMSHDLRTPLTAQIGYLELLRMGKCTDPEQQKTFIERSLQKALQIKDMAEKLFSYTLLYTYENDPARREIRTCAWVAEQLGEYAQSLRGAGFTVTGELPPLAGETAVLPDLLRRLWDNLYANVLKYADPARSVVLTCRAENGALHVIWRNSAKKEGEAPSGTHIGLKTCRRIAEYHGGTFTAEATGDTFRAELTLPLADTAE